MGARGGWENDQGSSCNLEEQEHLLEPRDLAKSGSSTSLTSAVLQEKGPLISTESNKLGEYVRSTFCGFCPPRSGFGVSFLERCEVGASPMWWLSPPSGAWEILACCVKTKAGPSWGFPACCVGQKASEAVMDGPGLWVNVEEVHFVW